jgi:hypothetical protein
VGSRAVLDAVVKRKIPSPRQESNPRTSIVQSVAQRYTVPDKILTRGWIDPKASQDVVAKKVNFAPAGNRTPVIQTIRSHFTN